MQGLDAKPLSLNDIIAAERQYTQSPENIVETPGNHISQSKKTSSLKYKKTFQIKSPAKPKKLKHLQRPRLKRKKLTSKREIQNEKINKYIPLLKNIGMLFDNILNSGSSETYNTRKYKRNQFITNDDERDDIACTCPRKYDPKDRSYPQKKTTPTPSTVEVEDETFSSVIITTTQAYNFADDNISGVGRNKDVPLLLTRNPSSIRRNNYRFRERSGSSYNGSFEGYITGVHRNNEYSTVDGERKSNTQHYDENSNGNTRNDTNSHRSSGRIRGIRTDSKLNRRVNQTKEYIIRSTNETVEDVTRHLPEHEGKIEFEIRRNETKSAIFLPEFTSRLREYNSEEKTSSIRISESNEKSLPYDYTSNKRVSDRDGSDTKENKTNSRTDKAITSLQSQSNSSFPIGKVVMIFDGYSVARDVNGENKLNEKAIHIHS